MRILGLDLGDRRVGVAVSDPLGLTAQGLPTLTRKDRATGAGTSHASSGGAGGAEATIYAIAELCRRLEVESIVIGLPRNMDGSYGPRAEMARDFGRRLRERTGLPVHEWDERLTTRAADSALLEADLSRRKRRGAVDRVAAVLILQGFLDRQRAGGGFNQA